MPELTILIVHITYDKKHAHTIIKNFPVGLGALIIYALSVYKAYPIWGIYIGTAVSFIMSTAYLFELFALIRMKKNIIESNQMNNSIWLSAEANLSDDRKEGGEN